MAAAVVAGTLCGDPSAPLPGPAAVVVPVPEAPPKWWEATILGPGGRGLEVTEAGNSFPGILLAATD